MIALGCHGGVAGLQMRFGLVGQVVRFLRGCLACRHGTEDTLPEGHADVAEQGRGGAVGYPDIGLAGFIVVQGQVGDVAADQ